MSFLQDFEAALHEEQRIKEALNKLRREHKAAKERVAQLREYAEEFGVSLDGDEPPVASEGGASKTSGGAPPATGDSESGTPDHPGEAVQN